MYMINPDGIQAGVIRLSDKASIPNCETNSDWQKYLQWLLESEENQPAEWVEGYGE